MDPSICEAISKLASFAAKWTLRCLISLCLAKAPRIKPAASTLQSTHKSASKPPTMVTIRVQIPLSPAMDKGKKVAIEGSDKEAVEAGNLPRWLAPPTATVVEFSPFHLRKHATSVGKAQTVMM